MVAILAKKNVGIFTDIEIGNRRPDFFVGSILPTNNVGIFPIWLFRVSKRSEATHEYTPSVPLYFLSSSHKFI